jgi:tRNA G18 (ribose-2'-O)-methylase SpoU
MGVHFRRYTTEELVASRPDAATREATQLPVTVVLDDVRSAHNVGLVFRLADCVNVEALWLCGITAWPGVTERATNRIAKTGVGGSLDVVPWRHLPDPIADVRRRKEKGHSVVVLEQGQGSVPWKDGRYALPLVLVLGHEREGVRDGLLDLADEVLELPVRGITNSLNVAVTAGVVLYEILERWRAAGGGREDGR